MRSIQYARADSIEAAALAARRAQSAGSANGSPIQFLAGGTTLLDLMKLDVMRPEHLIDISGMPGSIEARDGGLRLGGSVRMAEAAEQ